MYINNFHLPFRIVTENKVDCNLISLIDESSETTFMSYNINKTNTEELILEIIEGDIFNISYRSNCEGFNIISNFNHEVPKTLEDTKKCVQMIDEYYRIKNISFDDYPCFYIIRCNYPDANKVLGNFVQEGFSTCDHLVDFENNYLVVKTSKEKLSAMCMYYSIVNKNAGITFGTRIAEE